MRRVARGLASTPFPSNPEVRAAARGPRSTRVSLARRRLVVLQFTARGRAVGAPDSSASTRASQLKVKTVGPWLATGRPTRNAACIHKTSRSNVQKLSTHTHSASSTTCETSVTSINRIGARVRWSAAPPVGNRSTRTTGHRCGPVAWRAGIAPARAHAAEKRATADAVRKQRSEDLDA